MQPSKEPPKENPLGVSIQLPKGGRAIRGIGEKFAANPATGTGSMSVPIATSRGRSGFGPQRSLSYDSGAGNGPFGFGWSLSLPAITRKPENGLPRYLDVLNSDTFILSGAEDLVPVYRHDADGSWVARHPDHSRDSDGFWVRDPTGRLVIHEDDRDGYRVRRYRPRIEGLFGRLECWTGAGGDVHWRSVSRDNILTIYGRDQNSRIADATDPNYTVLHAVTHVAYRRQGAGYQKREMPPLKFTYMPVVVQDQAHDVDPASLENLPVGLDGLAYRWTDLHGEGIPGVLTEQAGAWYYKPNLTPVSDAPIGAPPVRLAAGQRVSLQPSFALAGVGQAEFMDLAGDGQPDLVTLAEPLTALFEHDGNVGPVGVRPSLGPPLQEAVR